MNNRRFGVELEYNTLSGVIKTGKSDPPDGAGFVADLINKAVKEHVKISGHAATNNNAHWVVKSDSSCGIEVCTPIFKGWSGLESLLLGQLAIVKSGKIKADTRCSFHVHVNISDLTQEQMAVILAHYIKFEAIFMDSVPTRRKINRYCSPLFYEMDINSSLDNIIYKLKDNKYYSVNCYQYFKSKKPTIEFRIGENDLCLEPYSAKCWVRLLLHFIEIAKDKHYSPKWNGSKWSGLALLDLEDFVEFMGFNQNISPGLNQVKNWFLKRISKNIKNDNYGFFNINHRTNTVNYLARMCPEINDLEMKEEEIFDSKFII